MPGASRHRGYGRRGGGEKGPHLGAGGASFGGGTGGEDSAEGAEHFLGSVAEQLVDPERFPALGEGGHHPAVPGEVDPLHSGAACLDGAEDPLLRRESGGGVIEEVEHRRDQTPASSPGRSARRYS